MRIGPTGFELKKREQTFDDKGKNVSYLTLGDGSYISGASYEKVMWRGHVLVGNYCSISHGIKLVVAQNHDYRKVTTYPFDNPKLFKIFQSVYPNMKHITDKPHIDLISCSYNPHQIIIGNDVWIGSGVTIMGGVHIGSGAVIGTNSTVTKDIPPYAIAAGNPARVVKYRFDQETIKKFMAIKWWNWDVKKIMENAPLMSDVEKFLEKHYTPDLEKVPYEKISQGGGWDIWSLKNILLKAKKILVLSQIFKLPYLSGRELSAVFVNRNLKILCL